MNNSVKYSEKEVDSKMVPAKELGNNLYKNLAHRLLDKADVNVNGSRRWDIQVNDESVYALWLKKGSIGLGESYMNGLWDCENLDEFICRILRANLRNAGGSYWKKLIYKAQALVFNQQSVKKAGEVGLKHYDVGNDLYEAMLGKEMVYSCAYWQNASSLEEAQEQKLDLICRKIKLQPGQKVLDVGCGWGGFARFAAQKYGAEVVGITISHEQYNLARQRCAGLPIEIKLQDYRSVYEEFDRIVSIGMFEHVGYKNYRTFMQMVHRCLKKNGLFLLHCIGSNTSEISTDPWINKYIFPNGMLPSVMQITRSIENLFVLEDWHNMGVFYDLTLQEWLRRFKQAWPELKKNYNERFYRMWVYYLSCSAASFRAKENNLWQIVFSRQENDQFYQSVR
ncbi:MAG TPA: cyclopropane fatty acyl phospholipid synthase [Daejeonella sp.]|nr:cyclopropane fatty acyl phospholipid synthase [Daejeonella sp.]